MAEPVHPNADVNSSSSEVKCWTTWRWSELKMNLYANNSVLCESFSIVSLIMFRLLGLFS